LSFLFWNYAAGTKFKYWCRHQVKIVPILVGAVSAENEAMYGQILAKYVDDSNNFFSISSDFCHWGSRYVLFFRIQLPPPSPPQNKKKVLLLCANKTHTKTNIHSLVMFSVGFFMWYLCCLKNKLNWWLWKFLLRYASVVWMFSYQYISHYLCLLFMVICLKQMLIIVHLRFFIHSFNLLTDLWCQIQLHALWQETWAYIQIYWGLRQDGHGYHRNRRSRFIQAISVGVWQYNLWTPSN